MIAWFAKNSVAANILMIFVIITGFICATQFIPVETFPNIERNTVTIATAFRGGTPQTVEQGVTLRIEEAIADIEGIEDIVSRSAESNSTVTVNIASGYDKRNILDDIKVKVDAITTLPENAENPIVSLNIRIAPVIHVAVSGQNGDKILRQTAERFRQNLILFDEISNVNIYAVADYQINIEATAEKLQQYNLSLKDIGTAIRNSALDISAGNLQTRDGDILVRSDAQAHSKDAFARIPVLSNGKGSPVTLGEIAMITDGFEDTPIITKFNGEPAVMMAINRVGNQSALKVAKITRDYIEEYSSTAPLGVTINHWDDDTVYLKSRIGAVLNSALYGGILVVLLLSLFLRPAVALWVCIGIPVSFMGAFMAMAYFGVSFNVISLFAFIMVLGIVVDDAIVTGENIYRKLGEGHSPLNASIIGTKEIALPVTFGILTTVVAFAPLSFLGSGRLSNIVQSIPIVVIPVLLMSLVESKLVLPSHLSHIRARKKQTNFSKLGKIQQNISRSLETLASQYYQPFLKKCLVNKSITIIGFIAISGVLLAWFLLGHLKYSQFPKVESDKVTINLSLPETTGIKTTQKYIDQISQEFYQLQDKYRDPKTGQSVITNILSTAGSSGRTVNPNVGRVRAEIQPKEQRTLDTSARHIAREIRLNIGDIPAARRLSVNADIFSGRAPINVQFSGEDNAQMMEMANQFKSFLRGFPTVFDIQDNFNGGKEELKITLKPKASLLGLRLSDVARQVRHAVFGFQAQRIQRGRNELRVMVKYPIEQRSSIHDLQRVIITIPNSQDTVLLSDIATLSPSVSPSALYRENRNGIISVSADIDKEKTNITALNGAIENKLQQLIELYPNVHYELKGDAEEQKETNNSLLIGLTLTLICIYGLLAIPFKSYGQPLIVMSIIPFSIFGALLGHIITLQNLSSMSLFGIMALVGVVVNDSLVLVDTINKKRASGMALLDAVRTAGVLRFRPVLLTSLTTFAGVVPLLLDSSQQAKFLKPMVTSLGFGILFATFITLVIVPVNYLIGHKIKHSVLFFFKSLSAKYSYRSPS